uniref:DUF5858 domain-containing protein n=1 Tax=Marseillevirus sp. TaxID=2809551 RepID=A0AA96EL96_9VIRU|nr:hypothetical protein MarFTMF_186 [Marseillevirus sp.]
MLEQETTKFINEVSQDLVGDWLFTKRITEKYISVSHLPKEETFWVKLTIEDDGSISYSAKIDGTDVFRPTERERCVRLLKRQVLLSETYQLMKVNSQLEEMNKNFSKLINLLSNGIEYSPNNEKKMEELEEHFVGLSNEQ